MRQIYDRVPFIQLMILRYYPKPASVHLRGIERVDKDLIFCLVRIYSEYTHPPLLDVELHCEGFVLADFRLALPLVNPILKPLDIPGRKNRAKSWFG